MHPESSRSARGSWLPFVDRPHYAAGMQSLIERYFGQALAQLAMQFLRFGTVGAAGFVVDTAVVYGLRG